MNILVIDDSDEDFDVFTDCLRRRKRSISVHRCTAGDAVLPFLDDLKMQGQSLDLIVLDLNLIGSDGKDVLRNIKDSVHKRIPVLIFSTSSSRKDIEACYELGANSYSCKPVDLGKFEDFVLSVEHFWFDNVWLPNRT